MTLQQNIGMNKKDKNSMELYKEVQPKNSSLTVRQYIHGGCDVIDPAGNIVIPKGRYHWIYGFRNGLARVQGRTHNTRKVSSLSLETNALTRYKIPGKWHKEQGIINERGEEVMPLEYEVWDFYNTDIIQTFRGLCMKMMGSE